MRNITTNGDFISFLNRWHVGIIRCNESAPCTGFNFESVNFGGWLADSNYICENVYGTVSNSNVNPGCFENINTYKPIINQVTEALVEDRQEETSKEEY